MKWDEVVRALESFYSKKGRKYPWREERDPYKLLVAEVLLQKTPAERCVEAYEEILEKYPSCEALASAPEGELRRIFSRLGLFKRCAWLKEACVRASEEFGSRVPEEEGDLLKLKGVGTYTARAVSLSCKGRGKLPVDANVRRVLCRLGVPRDAWNELVVSREAFYGLIDLAALVCKTKSPSCDSCPLSNFCAFASEKVKTSRKKS